MGTGSADVFLLAWVFYFVFAHLAGMGVLIVVLLFQLGVAFLDPFWLALEVNVLHWSWALAGFDELEILLVDQADAALFLLWGLELVSLGWEGGCVAENVVVRAV